MTKSELRDKIKGLVSQANNEIFYLIWAVRSWIAKIEGKKYYLLNLNEEERAIEAIARMLSYGISDAEMEDEASLEASDTASTTSNPGEGSDNEEVDINVDDEVDVEV